MNFLLKKDGKELLGFTKKLNRNEIGQIIGYSGIARDITKIKDVELENEIDTKKNRVI
jgi:hypothetical protein